MGPTNEVQMQSNALLQLRCDFEFVKKSYFLKNVNSNKQYFINLSTFSRLIANSFGTALVIPKKSSATFKSLNQIHSREF